MQQTQFYLHFSRILQNFCMRLIYRYDKIQWQKKKTKREREREIQKFPEEKDHYRVLYIHIVAPLTQQAKTFRITTLKRKLIIS